MEIGESRLNGGSKIPSAKSRIRIGRYKSNTTRILSCIAIEILIIGTHEIEKIGYANSKCILLRNRRTRCKSILTGKSIEESTRDRGSTIDMLKSESK